MSHEPRKSAVTGTCHCGAVSVTLPAAPTSITHCNCGLCRRYGVLWTYGQIAEVTVTGDTDTYAWNGENVDFHRCKGCGCVTHWSPRKSSRTSMGINARLFDPECVAAAELVLKDLGSGETQSSGALTRTSRRGATVHQVALATPGGSAGRRPRA